MEINFHETVCKPEIKRNVALDDWLREIKTGENYRYWIDKARTSGKGSKSYNFIKTQKLPAVNYNYLFDGYLKLDNAVGATGVFYVDIDVDTKEQAEQLKNKLKACKYVYSAWLSLSECGVGVLVRSSKVTPENFKQVHSSFCVQHNIPFDGNAVKLTQYNVLSNDPEIYVNPEASEYNPQIIEEKKRTKKKVQSLANEKREKKHIATNCTFLRYNNLNDYWKRGQVVTSEEGFEVVELFLPETIELGKRKHTLLAFTNNLVWLNPDAQPETIYKQLTIKNERRCVVPLESKELWDIVNSVFKYKENGTLEPQRLRTRKIIFGPESGYEKEEKRQFVNETIGEWKRNKTKRKIYEAIEGWNFEVDGKITAKKVSSICGSSIRTVKTYWSEFKDYVRTLNQENLKINVPNPPVIRLELQRAIAEIEQRTKDMNYIDKVLYLSNLAA